MRTAEPDLSRIHPPFFPLTHFEKETVMRWVKDPKVEANLRSLGLKFEVETVPMKAIDRDEGMRRQTRLCGKLMDDVVLRYALAMEAPDSAFPMPILQREKKRLWPWSGNHRLAAAELSGVESVEVYVVEVFDPVMSDLLPRLVNTWEAVIGQTREEAIINARYMHEKHRMPVADAVKMFGLRPDSVYAHARAEVVKKELIRIGVSANGFSQSLLDDLHTLSGNKTVFKTTAALIHCHKIKGRESEQIIKDVRSQGTELQQLRELGRWEEVLKQRAPAKPKVRTVKQGNRSLVLELLGRLARYAEKNNTREQMQLTDEADFASARKHWRTIVSSFNAALEKESKP